jgi:hypothetical protein
MNALPTILRDFLVASLLVSLSAAGLPPCVLAAESCAATTAHHAAKPCCCKSKCGVQCRMACCQAPAPTQDRAPASAKVSDDTSVTWGVASFPSARSCAATSADFHFGNSRSGDWLSAPDSLLRLSIRLNV